MKNTEKLKIAFENYFNALNELKALGVTKNKKEFTSQLGEWFVETLFDGKRSENGIQKYWDLDCVLGKIQVKTHAKATSTKARWSAIKYDVDSNVDYVAILVFTEDYKLREFYKVPWINCLNLIRRNKDSDVLMWDHLKEYKIEIDQLPKQEIVALFKV
jgi:hypothetical protein